MRKCDLDRVFQYQDEFPMHWKKEYIRLMTMFEVIVEIDADQILIPSHLKSKVMSDPFLMGSEFMVRRDLLWWDVTLGIRQLQGGSAQEGNNVKLPCQPLFFWCCIQSLHHDCPIN